MGHKNYKVVKAPSEYKGKKDKGKYIYEHHYIYWKNTGHILRKNEIIHHRDENPLNNVFSNLELVNRSEHGKHHHKKKELINCKCDYCKKRFKRKRNLLKYHRKNNKLGLFCSTSCGAKFQHNLS